MPAPWPVMTRILNRPARVEWFWVNNFSPNEYHIWHAWLSTCWHVENKSPKYEAPIFTAQTHNHWRKCTWRASVPKNGLPNWLNFMSCVMYVRFICYLCVQSKLRINTRSLFNQALKSAHRSVLSFRCWPWRVFSSWLASRALGIARFSYLARVGPMVLDTSAYQI